ncbi:hypothetical protein EYF80_000437 [Liparis tanakae]|uniref:Uncharacterized protein n=1 Tax=Liparis tanakae TaxID=230148 RepID=A0A4Z2JFW1_9TELE|nr:hypothetical protein EYF80_000437 [Liparis tanakae]
MREGGCEAEGEKEHERGRETRAKEPHGQELRTVESSCALEDISAVEPFLVVETSGRPDGRGRETGNWHEKPRVHNVMEEDGLHIAVQATVEHVNVQVSW